MSSKDLLKRKKIYSIGICTSIKLEISRWQLENREKKDQVFISKRLGFIILDMYIVVYGDVTQRN